MLQAPGDLLVALALYWVWPTTGLPAWIGVLAVLAWIAKDVALYPFVKRAYEPGGRHGALELVGREGVARGELSPAGQVRVGSEIWQAESADGSRIAAGASVRVTGASGFVLRVCAEGCASAPEQARPPSDGASRVRR